MEWGSLPVRELTSKLPQIYPEHFVTPLDRTFSRQLKDRRTFPQYRIERFMLILTPADNLEGKESQMLKNRRKGSREWLQIRNN
jgi:hypothetical protein